MPAQIAVTQAPWRPRHGERFNFYSHLAGLLLALAGACWMLARETSAPAQAGFRGASIYLCTLVGVFAASSALHFFRGGRASLQRLDHCMIYALIAGTYTPFASLAPSGAGWPWALLLALWAGAAAGVRREWRNDAPAEPSLALYAGLGWAAVAGAATLAARVSTVACAGLLAGALLYSAGTFFYRNRRGYAHAHGVWHLAVLAGAAAHYVSVALVLRAAPP
jgi:hemolysin III